MSIETHTKTGTPVTFDQIEKYCDQVTQDDDSYWLPGDFVPYGSTTAQLPNTLDGDAYEQLWNTTMERIAGGEFEIEAGKLIEV